MRERKGSPPNNEGFWFGEPYIKVEPKDLRALRLRAISFALGFDPPHGKIDEIEKHLVKFIVGLGTDRELEELGEPFQTRSQHKGTLKSGVSYGMGLEGDDEWREEYKRGARTSLLIYDERNQTAVIRRLNMTGFVVITKAEDLASRAS
ncbi:MAG: hypothetical protein NUV78_02300 [Candidatus Zambryskibacteria bacterium]|nr:hypothetical protein [Candidatus Zambryskibacteria bacterium]